MFSQAVKKYPSNRNGEIMKQTELSKIIGCSDAFISMFFSGIRMPSWTMAKRCGEKTGTDPLLWADGEINELKKILNIS